MPQPEGRALTQNFTPRLTNMAISFLPKQTMFIGRQVFPAIGVGAQFGEYNVLPRDEWLRPQAKKLANGESPPLGGFAFQKATYSVDEYGVSANWTNRDLNNAQVGGIVGLANLKTEFVTFQAHLSLEIDIATLVLNTVWGQKLNGVAAGEDNVTTFRKWSDPASDPIALIKQLKLTMRLLTGFKPNRMLMGEAVLNALTEHPDLIDRVKFTGSNGAPAKINKQSISALFEMDTEILVPEGVQNTAAQGAAANVQDIWGKNVFLWYAPDAPSIEVPSAGYRFGWTGAADSGGVAPQPFGGKLNSEGLYIARYVTQRPAAEWVESRWYTVPKVTAVNLGILLTNAV
jgi:hypothetical protein